MDEWDAVCYHSFPEKQHNFVLFVTNGRRATTSAASFERLATRFVQKFRPALVFSLGHDQGFAHEVQQYGYSDGRNLFASVSCDCPELELLLRSDGLSEGGPETLVVMRDAVENQLFRNLCFNHRHFKIRLVVKLSYRTNLPLWARAHVDTAILCDFESGLQTDKWRQTYKVAYSGYEQNEQIGGWHARDAVACFATRNNDSFDGTNRKLLSLFPSFWWQTPRELVEERELRYPSEQSELFHFEFDLFPEIWLRVFAFALDAGLTENLKVWVSLRSVCKSWRWLADDTIRWTRTQFCPGDLPWDDALALEMRFRAGLIAEWSHRGLVPPDEWDTQTLLECDRSNHNPGRSSRKLLSQPLSEKVAGVGDSEAGRGAS
jgi:hypothetical protein